MTVNSFPSDEIIFSGYFDCQVFSSPRTKFPANEALTASPSKWFRMADKVESAQVLNLKTWWSEKAGIEFRVVKEELGKCKYFMEISRQLPFASDRIKTSAVCRCPLSNVTRSCRFGPFLPCRALEHSCLGARRKPGAPFPSWKLTVSQVRSGITFRFPNKQKGAGGGNVVLRRSSNSSSNNAVFKGA